MEIPIIYEDDFIVAINKPPGIVVNRAQSVKVATIADWVLSRYPFAFNKDSNLINNTVNFDSPYDVNKEFIDRSGIVHRIDKETSGILLIAKTVDSFSNLKDQFMNRNLTKEYKAIVHGIMPANEGEIKAPVGRLPWNRERFGIVPDGKEAITKYKVLSILQNKSQKDKSKLYSYITALPKTGRTHQIRVHLKYINHPIVGDYLYAGRKTSREDRLWVMRVMLHAYSIIFSHPINGKEIKLDAPIPQDMADVILSMQEVNL